MFMINSNAAKPPHNDTQTHSTSSWRHHPWAGILVSWAAINVALPLLYDVLRYLWLHTLAMSWQFMLGIGLYSLIIGANSWVAAKRHQGRWLFLVTIILTIIGFAVMGKSSILPALAFMPKFINDVSVLTGQPPYVIPLTSP